MGKSRKQNAVNSVLFVTVTNMKYIKGPYTYSYILKSSVKNLLPQVIR